jgi:protein-tyrosine phosphatase
VPRFTVLHVCVGNICRSPMAERLLHQALRGHVGDAVDDLYLSHGCGTGSWHIGEPMNPPAARQLRQRGVDPGGFAARKITAALVDESDLVLCATSVQVSAVLALRPDAAGKTFVLGEFGRLLGSLPKALEGLPDDPYQRGLELVERVDARRDSAGAREAARAKDDLDDPWGMGDHEFNRVADEIERTVVPLAAALAGASSPRGSR